jgi:hypothetical protein
MLFCTQLAPARHVIQVGEKISTSRVWPSARLNSDLRAEMAFSEMTPPGWAVAPDRATGADVPGAGDTEEGDTEEGEHEATRRPETAAAITARADRDPLAVGHALPIASLFPLRMSSMPPGRRAASQISLSRAPNKAHTGWWAGRERALRPHVRTASP